MIDVRELKENYPEFALVLDVDDNALPNFANLAYRRVPVHDVEVDSYVLVGAGEVSNQWHNILKSHIKTDTSVLKIRLLCIFQYGYHESNIPILVWFLLINQSLCSTTLDFSICEASFLHPEFVSGMCILIDFIFVINLPRLSDVLVGTLISLSL